MEDDLHDGWGLLKMLEEDAYGTEQNHHRAQGEHRAWNEGVVVLHEIVKNERQLKIDGERDRCHNEINRALFFVQIHVHIRSLRDN